MLLSLSMIKMTFICSITFLFSNCVSKTYYQAYDPHWSSYPCINPIFDTEREAQEYAVTYNKNGSHSYRVRIVDYRYEIRQINNWRNEIIYTTDSLEDAKSYLHEYQEDHLYLCLFDLKKGTELTNR